MRIIEVSQRATDPIGDIKLAETYRGSNLRGRGQQQQDAYQGQYQGNHGQYHNHMEATTKITIMVTTVVEAAAAMDVIIIVDVGHGQDNYQGNDNYQYYQYYSHDDDYQTEQYGPPCALCGGYNHSPKHCFKGEHDIINIMEEMSLGHTRQQQSGLY